MKNKNRFKEKSNNSKIVRKCKNKKCKKQENRKTKEKKRLIMKDSWSSNKCKWSILTQALIQEPTWLVTTKCFSSGSSKCKHKEERIKFKEKTARSFSDRESSRWKLREERIKRTKEIKLQQSQTINKKIFHKSKPSLKIMKQKMQCRVFWGLDINRCCKRRKYSKCKNKNKHK